MTSTGSFDSFSTEELEAAQDEYEKNAPHYTRTLNEFRTHVRPTFCLDDDFPQLDLDVPERCPELIHWLNQWGNHIAKSTPADYELAATGFHAWWLRWHKALPPSSIRLSGVEELEEWSKHLDARLGRPEEESIVDSFNSLCGFPVDDRDGSSRAFKAVATSMILYVLRPHVFLPWNNLIMNAMGYDGSGTSYIQYVQQACRSLVRAEQERGGQQTSLATLQGRYRCTALELVNKLFWIRGQEQK